MIKKKKKTFHNLNPEIQYKSSTIPRLFVIPFQININPNFRLTPWGAWISPPEPSSASGSADTAKEQPEMHPAPYSCIQNNFINNTDVLLYDFNQDHVTQSSMAYLITVTKESGIGNASFSCINETATSGINRNCIIWRDFFVLLFCIDASWIMNLSALHQG